MHLHISALSASCLRVDVPLCGGTIYSLHYPTVRTYSQWQHTVGGTDFGLWPLRLDGEVRPDVPSTSLLEYAHTYNPPFHIVFVLSSFSFIIEVFLDFKLSTRTLYVTLLFEFNYPLCVLLLECFRSLIFWSYEFQTRLFRSLFWGKSRLFIFKTKLPHLDSRFLFERRVWKKPSLNLVFSKYEIPQTLYLVCDSFYVISKFEPDIANWRFLDYLSSCLNQSSFQSITYSPLHSTLL